MGSGLSQEEDTQQQSEALREAILKDADTAIDASSFEQLYAGVFLNQKRKKYWVDKASHGNCFLVYARDFSIIWGEDKRYWGWSYIQETSKEVVEVAELLEVCWLEIKGKFEISKLTPGMVYEVVFVVMANEHTNRWQSPLKVRLILPNGNKQWHEEDLDQKPRSKWFEIPVGDFMAEPKNGGIVEFSLYEYDSMDWKRGLLVKGAAIRPKH